MASLEAIQKTNIVRVPQPIKVIDLPGGGAMFVMEYLKMKHLNKYVHLYLFFSFFLEYFLIYYIPCPHCSWEQINFVPCTCYAAVF